MVNFEITGMLFNTTRVDLFKKVIVIIFYLVLKCYFWVSDLGCVSHQVSYVSLSKVCIALHKITSTTSKIKWGLKLPNNYKTVKLNIELKYQIITKQCSLLLIILENIVV